MRYRLGAAVAAGTLVVATLVATGQAPQALAQTVPASGLYSGPAVPTGVADHNSFATWLNSPVPYALEFLDTHGTWDQLANPYWALDSWTQWVQGQPGRRLVLSVPLLVSGSSGQLAQGASGAFDANFRTLAQNMVNRGLATSVIRLGWEMNNSSFPWYAGTDPASFRSFYARVVAVMRSVSGAAFAFDWNPNSGVQGGSPLTTFDSFYPGDAYVDVIGLDVYDFKWGDSSASAATRWNWMVSQQLGLNEHRAFAASHGKPVSFPEWGLYNTGDQMGGGGDSPYFIDRMADWFGSATTSYQSYFNADWGGGTLATFPNAQAEYRVRFGGSGTTTTAVAPTTTTTVAPTTTTTVAPLTVSNLRVSSVTANSAVITWTSSAPASSEVSYGPTAPTATASGVGGVTAHSVTVNDLISRTRYAYQVQSQDAAGAVVTGAVAYFTTAKR